MYVYRYVSLSHIFRAHTHAHTHTHWLSHSFPLSRPLSLTHTIYISAGPFVPEKVWPTLLCCNILDTRCMHPAPHADNNIHIYIYMYICIYTYIHMYICIYMCIYIYN